MKTTIISLIAIAVAFTLMNLGYDKSMEVHCKTLEAQATEYRDNPHYYITKLDHDECKEVYNIDIDAPVK